MNGTTLTVGTLLNPSSPGDPKWHVVGTGDFTQVGSTDLVFQHEDGTIAVWEMNGVDLIQGSLITPDNSGLLSLFKSTVPLIDQSNPELSGVIKLP